MKKYKILLTAVIAALSLNGCYDLDRHPFDQVGDAIFWQNETQVNQGMMGVYAALKNDNAFGLKFAQDNMSDIGVGYDNYGFGPVILGTYNDRTAMVQDKWKSLYDGVMRANLVIQKVPGVTSLSDELKTRFLAEARFLRAVYYFELYNFYGAIPLYDETVNLPTDYNDLKKPRNTVEEVFQFILNDLNYAAESNLPVKWEASDYGRATKGSVYGLRGKVYLYKKEYANAAKDFEEIILDPSGKGYNYSLYNDYVNLFKPEGHKSNEMVFAIQNAGGVGKDYGMPMTFYMGTRSTFGSCWNNVMPSATLLNMYERKDGKPFNWNDFIPGFNESTTVKDETFVSTLTKDGKTVEAYAKNRDIVLDMYKERDPRMDATVILPFTKYLGWVSNQTKTCEMVIARNVAPNEVNGFIRINGAWTESYIFRKFVAEGNMNGGINNRAHTPINFPLIRLADVYLMYAECKNELGDQATAVQYINKVRQRASTNMPAINSGPAWLAASSKDQVFERIKQERAVELAAEGHRWSDLRRWGIALKTLPGDVYGVTGKRLLTRSFTEKDMLWPIPGVEIERNPNLKPNNPGWD
ncbi:MULTISPECIES: RagB/SusD family nutrient uptake outer membrane protein [unclassified Dysgonomonas]|uniref:RagB/SusD family nutrient uptake outer membrane protein n=1 Tax=unclassified Dysgonomonas TaxID=2630389 RepID=UPI000680854C|nr:MULTISPECIES: RagB/SusD family nutrient uptake outer membrane protein [unclassified Dysgonomonas]MBD8346648.1 RagB/SusD family nutrient uptake outer membrane protein [Dysgonomonas sp. HGC4]MBF0574435.1 RagB/SusD family nutrient uptake outer membrane protein [Dysgonomonas sp. GY617]